MGELTYGITLLKNYNYKIFLVTVRKVTDFLEKYENNINYGTNSSNAILYAFLSGGYLAVILMIFIYFNLMRKY